MTIKKGIASVLLTLFLMSLVASAVAAAADPVQFINDGVHKNGNKKFLRVGVKDQSAGHSVFGKWKTNAGKTITIQQKKTIKGISWYIFELLREFGPGSVLDLRVYYPENTVYHKAYRLVAK